MLTYPFGVGNDSKMVVGYNEFVESNLVCDPETSDPACQTPQDGQDNVPAKIYMRHTPLGKPSCMTLEGELLEKSDQGWDRGMFQSVLEDIVDIKRHMKAKKSGKVDCMVLSAPVGRRIYDPSRLVPAETAMSPGPEGVNNIDGWWIEKHCVARAPTMPHDNRDDASIPIPYCKEKPQEEEEETQEAFTSLKKTSTRRLTLAWLIGTLVLVLLAVITGILIRQTAGITSAKTASAKTASAKTASAKTASAKTASAKTASIKRI